MRKSFLKRRALMRFQRFLLSSIVFSLALPLCVFAQKEDILIINSYHQEYAWFMSWRKGVETVLGEKYNLHDFGMDTKRLPSSQFEERAKMAWEEYKEINPVLVIMGDDNALKYVGPMFINTKTPVVYLGINGNPRNYNMVGHENVTGVLERPMMKRSAWFIQKMVKPTPKKILVMLDDGESSRSMKQEGFFGENLMTLGEDLVLDAKLTNDFDVWQKTLLDAKNDGYGAVIFGSFHTIVDKQGNYVDTAKVLEWSCANTPIPPFTFTSDNVGKGKTIGGLVLLGEGQGQLAGEMALKILSGEKPGSIQPTIGEEGRFIFSKEELKRWGLDLPEDIASKAEYKE
jgi:ABC-type uncharacterized transport system substrate-binding protein